MIAVFDQDRRIEVEYPGMRREVTPPVVRHVVESESGDEMNLYSRLNEANAAENICAQVVAIEQQVWDEDFSGLGDYLGEGLSNYPEQMSVTVADVADQLSQPILE